MEMVLNLLQVLLLITDIYNYDQASVIPFNAVFTSDGAKSFALLIFIRNKLHCFCNKSNLAPAEKLFKLLVAGSQ